jgi:hypothetical protein
MYNAIPVQELTQRQISKLLNGHVVSVKPNPNSRHSVLASQEQVKKMRRAYKKGSGMRMQLDPYQIQMHQGSGFFSNILSKALPMVKNVVKNMILPKAQDFLMSKGQEFIPSLLDKGISKLQSTKVGSYIPDDILDMARNKGSELALSGLETGLNKASDFAKVKIGSGMRKKLSAKELMLLEHMKYKKGSGFLNDLLGNIPFVGNILQGLDNNFGSGMKPKRSGRALYPSGFM